MRVWRPRGTEGLSEHRDERPEHHARLLASAAVATLADMASVPAQAFHDEVASSLTALSAEMLDDARGGGLDSREMNRSLMLADRAAREWAASAIASERPGAPNRLEQLDQLGKPEDAHHALDPAARSERAAATSTTQRDVARAVEDLAAAVQELDTEASAVGNAPAFRAVGKAAADVLVKSAAVLGDEQFIVEQANAAMADLVALAGWENRLGPRFE